MRQPEPHPDTYTNQQAVRNLKYNGRQATTTAAMNAMYDALEEGKTRQEAEEIYCSYFNKSHERK